LDALANKSKNLDSVLGKEKMQERKKNVGKKDRKIGKKERKI